MTDRDELESVLVNVLSNAMNYPDPVVMLGKDTGPLREKVVDAVLAAGYRKPRTITTVEEAAALPEGTVIRTIEQGYVFELAETIRNKAYGYSFAEETGSFIDDSYLPATVLYIPEEQS